MSVMNIAGLTPVEDPSYRYKMPRIQGKVEGRGNGIKTVLVNVSDVGLSLNREGPEICKFFGCELGSQTTYAADTDRAIVNGAHTDRDLQNHLSRYIENFVLCKSCRLPETYYKIKTGIISQKCNACGAKHAVDMTHKLTTFILAQSKKHKESAKAEKKDKEKDKEKKSKKGEDGEDKKSKKDKSRVVETDNADEEIADGEASPGSGGAGAGSGGEPTAGSADAEETESVAMGKRCIGRIVLFGNNVLAYSMWQGKVSSVSDCGCRIIKRLLQL
jgi:translation initiation factor 5